MSARHVSVPTLRHREGGGAPVLHRQASMPAMTPVVAAAEVPHWIEWRGRRAHRYEAA
ncbi:hypothetical protein [Streptomyces atratus]|uniref:Uncharacterized protein n=1 Tax=Streptomyces atratus TaxID=1893 RepID=A0A1K2F7I7_STRAR|nr:hypothetical protein SAMN02787144_10348 [Streptomyces atratus]